MFSAPSLKVEGFKVEGFSTFSLKVGVSTPSLSLTIDGFSALSL